MTTTTMIEVHAVAPGSQLGRDQAEQIREQVREQIREQMREQAQQARERAQQIREQAQREREAAQDARRIGVPFPPTPPGPQGPEIGVPPRGPWGHEPAIPGEVVDIVGMLTFGTAAVLILRPLMRAFANRFERRGTPPVALPPEVTAHMQRLEQAIEAVAIEVERISEGQRYTTKLLSERAGKSGSGVG